MNLLFTSPFSYLVRFTSNQSQTDYIKINQ